MSTRFAATVAATIAFPLVLLAGCASFEGIEPQVALRSAAQFGARATPVVWPQAQWWAQLGDAQLDALVTQALAGNPQLETARARLERAQAAVAGTEATRLPHIELQGQSTWQRYSEHYLYPPPLGGSSGFANTLQVSAAWEFDFFGRQRAALRSAQAAGHASAAEAQAARVLIACAVVRSYLRLAHQLHTRTLLDQALTQRQQLHALVQARVRHGLDGSPELRRSEAALAATQRQIEAVDEQAVLMRHALAALVGAGPEATRTLAPRMRAAVSPSLPAALPAELIGHRADISAARWRVEAAAAQVDVAKARFYPNVNLLAFVGLQSLGFPHWLELGSTNAGVGPAITLPLFDAGALRAALRGRSAELDAAVADYNATLAEAVRDVADQIASLQSLQKQAQQQQAALDAAAGLLTLAMQRQQAGLATRASVLAAEGELLAQQATHADLQARQADTFAALMRALGGGFDARAAAPLETVSR